MDLYGETLSPLSPLYYCSQQRTGLEAICSHIKCHACIQRVEILALSSSLFLSRLFPGSIHGSQATADVTFTLTTTTTAAATTLLLLLGVLSILAIATTTMHLSHALGECVHGRKIQMYALSYVVCGSMECACMRVRGKWRKEREKERERRKLVFKLIPCCNACCCIHGAFLKVNTLHDDDDGVREKDCLNFSPSFPPTACYTLTRRPPRNAYNIHYYKLE